MSRDAVPPQLQLTAWRQRTRALHETATRLTAVRDRLVEDADARRREVAQLTARVEMLGKVGELLRALLDKLVLDQVRTIEGVVTEGLRAIFPDLGLAFEAEVGAKYNKIAIDFLIRQGEGDAAVRGAPLESFGGGPSSVSSLILRLLVLMRLKKFPLLLLDETLAAVSDEYLDDAGEFLRKLAATTGIDILLVTHKAAYLDHADHAFQGYEDSDDADGSWSLALHRIRGRR